MRALFLSIPLIFLGCGGSSGTPDAAVPPDAAVINDATGAWPYPPDMDWSGVICGTDVCQNGQPCCLEFPSSGVVSNCSGGCPDGGNSLYCDGPEDCSSGAAYCCANVSIAGSLANLKINSASSQCLSACTAVIPIPPVIPLAATLRLCHYSGECAGDARFPTCCQIEQGSYKIAVCINANLKSLFPAGSAICDQ